MKSLAVRDQRLSELMDDPDADPVRLARTLERFDTVNRLVAGWGTVYRTRIRPYLLTASAPVRILDVGCGGGDVLARVVGRAQRDGFDVSGVGVDPDARALEVAKTREIEALHFRQAHSRDLVEQGDRFDIVLSNHVMHHLSEAELTGLLADSEALSSGICLHADISRSGLAYGAYALGITPFAPGTFLRTDGLRSIRRSYTQRELAARLPDGWSAERPVPFRVLAFRDATEVRP